MPAMRTSNLYSYCLSLLLVLLAVTGHTWQPAHSELRLHAHREKQFPALSAELAICRPCGPQICIRIVWAFYLCYLLWLGILGSRPILSWDCMLTGRCAVKMKQIPALSAELAICRPCGPQICIRIVWAFYLFYLLWLRILGSRHILGWDCMLRGRCAVKMKQIPALSAELAICRPCRPQICIRIVWAFYLFYLLWLRMLGSRPILSWDCMLISWVGYMPAMRTPNLYSYCLSLLLVLLAVTGHTWQPAHSELRLLAHRQMCCEDETNSCVISWVGYMPAMRTPNLYSYCLSLLLVLLAVTENAWQPAHSGLRLHAHRQMCCEDETNSCVISWVGYMPAMRTPNLYSYCLSLLLVLLAVTKNAWQPAHSELRLHAHRQMCCEDETNSCVISWVGYMPAMRTPNLYSYCLSLLLVLLAVTGHTWQPAHSELRLHAHRQMCCEDETNSCVISWVGYMPAMRTSNLYSYCLSLLLVLLAMTENIWQPAHSELRLHAHRQMCCEDETNSCVISWVGYMPAMRTPNLYSYCLSLLLVLLAVTENTWQPAHSELRLLAQRQMCCEDETNSCVISWVGYMPAMRTSNLYSYCLSLLLVLLAVTENAWQPILSWDCMLTGRCAVKMKQIPALSAELAICQPCGPQICIRIVWAFYLFYLLWLRMLGSQPILSWDCMLTGRCAVKMKQIPALSAELAICRPCRPQICIRIVWAFYLFYLLWLRMLGSQPILSWDCMLTGRCAVKMKQIPALSAELAICRPCGPQICIRIVWDFYLCYLLWLRILGSRPILGWDCMLTGRCAVKMKQIPALSAELASYMPAMRTPNLYSYCLSLLLVLLAVTENTWQPAHSELRLHAQRQMCCEDETISCVISWVGYMPAMRTPNLYSYCPSLLLVLLAVTENTWQPAHSELRLYVHRQMGDVVHVYRSKPSKPSFRDVHCYVPAIFYACSMILQSRTLSCIQVPPE